MPVKASIAAVKEIAADPQASDDADEEDGSRSNVPALAVSAQDRTGRTLITPHG
jgi:hypothetical protein